jgi:transposase
VAQTGGEDKLAGVAPSWRLFAEVQIAEPPPPASQTAACSPGLIQIDLPGGVRVSVDVHVDAGVLAGVLSVLR